MPEPTTAPATLSSSAAPPAGTSLDPAELEAAVAEAILATPGVFRLEPTLHTAGLRGLVHRHPTDGIQLIVRGDLVDADINVATSSTHQARAVAEHVHHRVIGLLAAAERRPGTITVNVLAIDFVKGPT